MPTSHIWNSPHDNNLYEEVGQKSSFVPSFTTWHISQFHKKEKRKKKKEKRKKKKKTTSTPDYTLYEIKINSFFFK
jgi:hypothetical protein